MDLASGSSKRESCNLGVPETKVEKRPALEGKGSRIGVIDLGRPGEHES